MNGTAINPADISVVIQGAIDKKATRLSAQSIRRHLPGAQIIISTWVGSKITDIPCDCVVYSADPGGYKDQYASFTNNTLRELVSTQKGLQQIQNKYTLKIRSDMIFKSARFLSYFNLFSARNEQYAFFRGRVIVLSFFTKRFLFYKNNVQPVPFHVSDWLAFGLSEDISLLYDIDLPIEPDFSWYLFNNKNTSVKSNLLCSSHQYAPEQYITVTAFKKKFDIHFDHYLDYNNENIQLSQQLIANNYIILSPTQFKCFCAKERTGTDYYKCWSKNPLLIKGILRQGLYTYFVFLQDYKTYCDAHFKIPLRHILYNRFETIFHQVFG